MRMFIGFKLNEANNQKIINLQRRLKQDVKGNFTNNLNLHVTLVFLGELDSKQILDIKAILKSIKANPININTTKIKMLKDMAILEFEKTEELDHLYQMLYDKIKVEYKIENRKYYPHMTLIRRASKNIEEEFCLEDIIKEIYLFSSEVINNNLTYIVRESVKLC